MTPPPAEQSSHWRAVLRRQLRGRVGDFVAVCVLVIAGLAVTLGILSQQKAALPSWVPFFGQEFFHLEGEFTSAQAVTPGQGQAVMVAGIQIGKIDSVRVEDGHAVVGMDIEPKYAPLIHPDAHLLLRPKTNLNDMVVEVDPGERSGQLPDGSTIPLSRTQANVNPDEFLAMLDSDTRDYLTLLLQGGAEGLGGKQKGVQLSAGLRRLEPFARYTSQLTGALAKRRATLARVVHDFGLLTEELGSRDDEIARFVDASSAALGGFADQQDAIREALRQLPPTLSETRRSLTSADALSNELRPTLTGLIPQAQALGPALRSTQDFLNATTEPLRTQLRPFTQEVRPPVHHVAQAAAPLRTTVTKFGKALGALNYGFNELAFDPGQRTPGYLFYLPWLNHNLNANYQFEDATGPMRRGLLLLSCNSASLAGGFVLTRPYLQTIFEATNVPTGAEIC
jgi:phospholipid/cholesterol/gamma-HCH transport system substrate-binding protein